MAAFASMPQKLSSLYGSQNLKYLLSGPLEKKFADFLKDSWPFGKKSLFH